MYPRLQIGKLPPGLSLDWLASSLARRGIGLLPLATFARTEKGFETGRTTFRLTLGGVDSGEILAAKTRRLLIDLNRLIADEDAQYNRKRVVDSGCMKVASAGQAELVRSVDDISKQILQFCANDRSSHLLKTMPVLDHEQIRRELLQRYRARTVGGIPNPSAQSSPHQ